MPDPTYIQKGPYPYGHTSFDQNGTTSQAITNIAEPPVGSVGPLSAANVAVLAQIFTGTGVPSISAPQGSLFLRQDGTTADTILYVRNATAWVAILGAT
jgi:hypothetical protein